MNKTYPKDEKPTGSAPKSAHYKAFFVLAAVLLGVLGLFIYSNEPCTEIAGKCYELETVKDEKNRMLGLSGRESLPQDSGMLFIFDDIAEHCMWMKDMKFPLDIVWLDSHGTIIDMKERISPQTYPASFCPGNLSKYVIELNSGEISQANIKIGDKIVLN